MVENEDTAREKETRIRYTEHRQFRLTLCTIKIAREIEHQVRRQALPTRRPFYTLSWIMRVVVSCIQVG